MILKYRATKVKRQRRHLSGEWDDVRIRTNIENGKVDSIWGAMQLQNTCRTKKALNKSCSKLNFVQKSLSAYFYLPPRVEVGSSKDSHF